MNNGDRDLTGCVLGVDAGNSKTIALVAALDGTVLGAGRGGCGDIYGAVSVEAALGAVEMAVTTALRAAGVDAASLVAGGFNMAGADWPEDYAFLQAAMERRGYGRRVVIVHDAMGALRAGSPDGTGVSVVCGTGAAIGARAMDGRYWHVSFWQEALGGDELSRQTLHAVYRAALGIDPPTSLTARVLEVYDQPGVEDLLHRLTARTQEAAPSRGRLVPILLDEAGSGDVKALSIVRGHGTLMGDYALAAARRVGLEGTAFGLVLAGGVLRHPAPLLVDAIVARVRATSPDVRPIRSRFEPVVGALFLALDAVGVPIDEYLQRRLTDSMPAADLFAT